MSHANACPVCDEGSMQAILLQEQALYKGVKKTLPMRFSQCSCCGSEIASHTDLRENKRIVNEFKKTVEGFTTGAHLKYVRQEIWKITQEQASAIFGGGPKAFSKYESDDVIQSEAMDKLIKLAIAIPEALEMLKEMSGQEVTQEKRVVITNPSTPWVESCIEPTAGSSNIIDNQANNKEGYFNPSAKSWRVKKVA